MDNIVTRATVIIALEELRQSLQSSELAEPSTRRPRRERGESGAEYIRRLLNENSTSCKEQLRLDKIMFVQLVNLLKERNLLVDGKYIKVDEQLGICLYILAKGASYRDVADRFKHFTSTICKYFKQVLDALVDLSYDIIRPHRDLLEVPQEVESNPLYWPYFKDAIGALDGTLIQAVINDENGVPFRTRKGTKSWNVLSCVSFDRFFTYVNVGWEGSAHDITVWRHSLTDLVFGFPYPPKGKYYLVDSGYPNTLGYLSPINDVGVRYHMPEYKHGPPNGISEHFNYRHSSLRMKVEMAFGQLKKRWKVVYVMPQMSPQDQMKILMSVFTLHNFIRMHKLGIPIIQHVANARVTPDSNMFGKKRKKAMSKVRNKIAKAIWRGNGYEADDEDDDDDEDEDEDDGEDSMQVDN